MLSRTVFKISILRYDVVIPNQILPALLIRATSTSTVIPKPLLNSNSNLVDETIRYSGHGEQQNFCYTYMFSRLKSPPLLSEVKRLHGLLVINGFFNPKCPDRVLGSQLVSVYVNFGRLQEALLLFDNLPDRSNNLAWNSILRGLIETGEFSNAIEFYHLMLRQGQIPDNFTYPLVLKACSGLNDLEQGRSIQNQILINENNRHMKGNIFVECALIDMFAKCGSLNEAREVFEKMLNRDLASWTAMICGAVHSGEWFEALCLFKRMRLEGLEPDSVIVAAVLPSCGRLEEKQMGMLLHGCAIRSGLDSDLFVSNALIDMYYKCSDIYEARRIFREMGFKDAVSWSTLITGLSQNCQYHESYESYLEMKKADIRTNSIIAASVLPGLGKLKLLKQGKEMHGYIVRQAFESDVVLGSALIDMYSNCESMREAKHIFEMMLESGITIWNSMIVGCSRNGDVDLAFELLRRIWEYNLRPNSITLLSILPMCTKMGSLKLGKEIHGYVMKNQFCKVVSIGNAIIDMYSKCGFLEYGVKMFNQMMEKNIVTYNTIISALGNHGRGKEAFTFFVLMKEEGIRPNKVTFVALLSACSHSGLLDRGWFLFNSMRNDYHIQPDMEHYSCMVDLLGRSNNLHVAFDFIRMMPAEPNIDVWGSLLGACRVYNEVELAEVVGERILQKNQKDLGHYALLSNIYASEGRWNEALKVRTMIKETGLIKKPGSSWIQIGSSLHVFHATDKMHPEFTNIHELLESLFLDIKYKKKIKKYY